MNESGTIDLLGRLDAVVFGAMPATLQLTFCAGGALKRLGFSVEECVNDPHFFTRRLHPDEREATLAMFQAVASDGKERQIEHRMVGKEGDQRWFRTEAHAVKAGGEPRLLGLMLDVTEAHRIGETLRATESRLHQVLDHAPLVLYALDANGIVTVSEGSGLFWFGLRPGEAVGKSVWELFPKDAEVRLQTERALAGEAFTSVSHVGDGDLWWETRWSPIFDAEGKPAGCTAVTLNVTDQKEAEDRSRASMSLLRATLEATTDGILVVDRDLSVIDYNQRFAEMWRLSDELLATGRDDLLLKAAVEQLRDPEEFVRRVRALYAEPDAVSHDVLELRDGRIFERDSRPQRVNGVSVGRVWSFRDVTAERRAVKTATLLARASKLLAAPIEDEPPLDALMRLSIPLLGDWCNILMRAPGGKLECVAAHHVDPSKVEILRSLRVDDDPAHGGVAQVIASGEPEVLNDITDAYAAEHPAVNNPELLRRILQLEFRAYIGVPLRARGEIIGAMTFATSDPARRYDEEDLTLASDLAQRAALAIENQRLYRAAKQAVALRDEFLSVASHELRTPVTSLQLAVQGALSLGHTAPAGFVRRALEAAERQSRRLGRLVDALLDVSRIQAGRLELAPAPTDLIALVNEVVTIVGDDARRAGCVITLETAFKTLVGRWDRVRLEQVVINLLSNAFKYGAGAPVTVRVSSDGKTATLEVRDQGIGVAAAERDRIFERFERAVSARHYGGLGLGLYIVRRIIDAHAGTIVVESAPGSGARFIVELPL